MPTGPSGEKRPVSPVSSMVKAMRVVTGIEEEEYEDGKPRVARKPSVSRVDGSVGSSSDELEGDHLQMAARRIADPAESNKSKKKRKRT